MQQSPTSLAQKKDLLTPQTPLKFHLNTKKILLDEKKFFRSLLTHLKTSKSASYETGDSQIIHKHLKACQKVLKTQDKLSNLYVSLDTFKHMENKPLLSTIQHFSSLSSLSLPFANNFDDETIPQQILLKVLTPLKHLNHLDLSFYFLVFDDHATILKNLIRTIQKLRKLNSLSLQLLNCYDLTSLHFKALFSSLIKLTQLRTLKLGFDNSDGFTNTDIEALASVLPKLSFLTRIGLSCEGQRIIQEKTLVRLFRAFQHLKNLKELALNLKECELTNEDFPGSIKESFECLVGTSIEKLSLGLWRNLSNQNLQELSQALKELVLLKSLTLNMYDLFSLSYESIIDFGSALACLVSLNSLILYFPHQMTNPNIVPTIASALKSLKDLVSLKLDFRCDNATEDQHFQALFENFKELKSLKYLDIGIAHQSRITDSSLEVLAESFKELKLLKNLSLDFVSVPLLTNKGFEVICSGIQEGLPNLFSLRFKFYNNEKLNEKAINKLGEALQALVSLYSVDLCLIKASKEDNLKGLFKILKEMKGLGEIQLTLPDSRENKREMRPLKKTKNVDAYFFKY